MQIFSNIYQSTDIISPKLRKALELAAVLAVKDKTDKVLVKHLLASLLVYPDSASFRLAKEHLKINPQEVVMILLNRSLSAEKVESARVNLVQKDVAFSKSAKNILEEAIKIAKKLDSYYLGTEHVLVALVLFINSKRNTFKNIFRLLKLDTLDVENWTLDTIQKIIMPFRFLEEKLAESGAHTRPRALKASISEDVSEEALFHLHTQDITSQMASVKPYEIPVIREEYVSQLLEALVGQTTNNALLVGAPGIGKTSIVKGLAYKIAKKQVPRVFQNKRIYRVNIPDIIATSRFPMDIEKRVIGVFSYAYGRDDVILFVDNIQYLLQPNPKGGINLYSVLLPILEEGKLNFIGTMPTVEYRVASDFSSDFGRLFKVINVAEPRPEETLEIINRLIYRWREWVRLRVSQKELSKIIDLVDKYMSEEVMPTKVLKVIDSYIAREFLTLVKNIDLAIPELEDKLKEIEGKKAIALEAADVKVLDLLEKKSSVLRGKIEILQGKKGQLLEKGISITLAKIRKYLSTVIDIPSYTITTSERTALLKIEDELKKYIVAQEEAIEKVAYAIKRGRLGIRKGTRPWASFLFLGPTGVGKTELAKVLARYLFGDQKDRLIQIDMSEYMESHSVSRLIGSPPGYVGFEQGGYLTEKMKQNPYSVVLFDEIEKAAPNVLNILLQILEDARLTDAKGETVSFRNAIVILTSNVGAEQIFKDKILGFYRSKPTAQEQEQAYQSMKETLLKELYKRLRPELINRLDEIIIFRTLTRKDAGQVLDVLVRELNTYLLQTHNWEVKLSAKAKRFLLRRGFSKEFGARSLRRILQRHVENTLADYILKKGLRSSRRRRRFAIDVVSGGKALEVVRVENS